MRRRPLSDSTPTRSSPTSVMTPPPARACTRAASPEPAFAHSKEPPMTDKVLTQKDGAIGRIVFNNPDKLNAISLEMWEGMGRAVSLFEADPEVRVIVVSGAGGVSFIAGAD